MGFPRYEYWSGLPFFSPEDFPDPGIKPTSPTLAGGFFTTVPPGKPLCLGLSSCKPTYSRRDTIKPPHALTTIITFIGRSVRILWPCFKTITESNLPNTIIRMWLRSMETKEEFSGSITVLSSFWMWLPDIPHLLPHRLSCTKDSHCTRLSSLFPFLHKCLIVLQRCPWGQTQEQPVMPEPPNVIYVSSPAEWNWGPLGPPLLAHSDSLITEAIPVLPSPTHSFPLLSWSPLTPFSFFFKSFGRNCQGVDQIYSI